MALLAGSLVDSHAGALVPSRHIRPLALAAVVVTLLCLLRSSGLFHPHYESGFRLVNPSKTPPVAAANNHHPPVVVNGPPPAALQGDDFYITDALHHQLNPDPPPPAPETPPPPPPPPPPREFPHSVAVLMETDVTRVPHLVPLVLHFVNLLGPDWPVVILTLRATWVEPASPVFRRYMAEQRIRVHFLPEDTAFPTHADVSLFFTRPWLWERYAEADRVLLFQADSVLCGQSARRVDDFAEWDFVGAPIAPPFGAGYNGGLSLRNPKLLLDLVRDPVANDFEALLRASAQAPEGTEKPPWAEFEDQWFYHALRAHRPDAKLPPPEVAMTFSVETVWYDKPLGYHQPFRWLTEAQKKEVFEYCPEVALLHDGSHFY